MSFSGMGRVTGYGRSRVQVLLYCWALRFVFVHAKAVGFQKESARSVFTEKTPVVTRYLPVRFRCTTSARTNRFFLFCFVFSLVVEHQDNASAPGDTVLPPQRLELVYRTECLSVCGI